MTGVLELINIMNYQVRSQTSSHKREKKIHLIISTKATTLSCSTQDYLRSTIFQFKLNYSAFAYVARKD